MDRRLVLVRHAKSDYPPATPDHGRPLAERGRRDAPEIGRWIDQHVEVPSGLAPVVLVSTARRTQQTWALAAGELGERWASAVIADEPRIYEASVDALRRLVAEVPDEVRLLVIVGHNPGMLGFVATAADPDGQLYDAATAKFPTSAVAVLTTGRAWADTDDDTPFDVTAFHIPRG